MPITRTAIKGMITAFPMALAKSGIHIVRRTLLSACPLCGGAIEETLICIDCLNCLPYPDTAGNRCPVCAIPANHGELCGRCISHPPAFDRVYAAFIYAPPIDSLIRNLKFGHRLADARTTGMLLAASIQKQSAPTPDIILPVPIHIRRLRYRGFNQSFEIAKIAGRQLSIPVDTLGMTRVNHHQPQTALSRKQRLRLSPSCFSPPRRPLPQAARVALVDDVVTTAATVNAVAGILKRAGAAHVDVWAVSRTLPSL